MWNRLMQLILYRSDPVFRKFVDSKRRGPNDKVGTGETVLGVLRKQDGSKRTIQGRK